MRKKLFIGSALAVVLAVATAAFAGAFTKARPTLTPEPVKAQPSSAATETCCTLDDCCLERLLCCSIDGCCEECIQCCIDMGCDPSCCFPALAAKAEAPKKAEPSCADAKSGCCAKPAKKTAKGGCGDGCCR